MLAENARIVSPTHRRIFPVDMEDPESVKTAKTLMQVFGWKTYNGPGEADKSGWVIRGTDSALTPMYATPRRVRAQQ